MTDSEASDMENRRCEEEFLKDSLKWPQYFVTGEEEDAQIAPALAYWKVEGPNGPVLFCNPQTEPHPVTMYELVMERGVSFRHVQREDTPWGDDDE